MKYIIDFLIRQENEARNVVFDEAEIPISGQVPDVGHIAGYQIIDRDDPMAFRQQPIGQMRAEESGAASDHGDRLRTRHDVLLSIEQRKNCQQETR